MHHLHHAPQDSTSRTAVIFVFMLGSSLQVTKICWSAYIIVAMISIYARYVPRYVHQPGCVSRRRHFRTVTFPYPRTHRARHCACHGWMHAIPLLHRSHAIPVLICEYTADSIVTANRAYTYWYAFFPCFLRPCVSLEWHFGAIGWSWLSCIGAWRAG